MAEPYDPVGERALFAQKFKGTTNLDQRRRFAQDITEAQARDEERRAAEYERAQRQNPELMRAETGRQAENRLLATEIGRKNLAERKFQWDQEKAGRMEQLNAKRLELQMRSEERALRKEAMELDRMDKQEEDMLAVEDTEYALRQQFGPGTPEYKQGLVEAFLAHPNVDKSYRQMALKESGFEDPDAAYEDAAIKLRDFPGSRATIPLAGGGKATIVGPEATDIDAQIAKAQDRRARAVKMADEQYLSFADQELARLQGMRGQSTPAAQAPAPTTNFTDPESFKKAYQSAASGTVLDYNGKKWRKP